MSRLSGPEGKAIEAHVETCPRCQQALERLTGAKDEKPWAAPGPREIDAETVNNDFLRRLEKEPPAGTALPQRRTRLADSTNQPIDLLKQPLPGVPTADMPEGGVSPPVPARRIQVTLAAGSGSHLACEIETLLRSRLRIFSLICLFDPPIYGLYSTPSWIQGRALFGKVWLDLVGIGFFFAIFALLARFVWSRRRLSLTWLRVIELILFGVAIGSASVINVPTHLGALVQFGSLGQAGGWAVGSAVTLPAFAAVVAYGMFIPNTWRRCAAIAAVMALCPLVVSVAAMALSEQAIDRDLQFAYFLNMGAWMALAAVWAVLGSHRISVLEQQAFEARRLGQYQLKQRLGAGGMGEVYLAEHALLHRPCAIKLIRPERAGDPRNLARFEREVQATATLTHPNTVEIFDYGHAADGTFYYVMEYLPGLSLEELVKQHGPLPPMRVVHLLRQVCGALAEAHAAGLIHRDVKPSNIIVGQRGGQYGVAKLLDFGLVQSVGLEGNSEKLTQEGAIAGTPAYMSPEQAAGKAELDRRSDLYSLGCVAYFLLTGQPPFLRKTAVQILAAHLSEPVVPPEQLRRDLSADLQSVVLRCLEKEPGRRFEDAESLEQALGQCACATQWTRDQAAAWWLAASAAHQQKTQPPAECVS
jgi:serine/threonine-protein kinase